jgi:acyl-CoA synthetase (AMP-forming)/AMP-acid ligase II
VWRYCYRAIDKHGTPVDFLLTAKRDLEAAKRSFRKMLQDESLLSPHRIGTDAAGPYPPATRAARKAGLLARTPLHYVTKHLQQRIESDHVRVKRAMPRVGGFQSFPTARRTIQGLEAMLWLRQGFGFSGPWTVREQPRLLAVCFGLPQVNKAKKRAWSGPFCGPRQGLRHARLDADDLRRYCAGLMSAYKIPSKFLFVKSLPKGPTGKILKRALRAA